MSNLSSRNEELPFARSHNYSTIFYKKYFILLKWRGEQRFSQKFTIQLWKLGNINEEISKINLNKNFSKVRGSWEAKSGLTQIVVRLIFKGKFSVVGFVNQEDWKPKSQETVENVSIWGTTWFLPSQPQKTWSINR